jgi:hypothetical protein
MYSTLLSTISQVWPVFNDDGSYFQEIDFDLENPVAFLKNASNKRRENFYQGHARIDYDILKDGVLERLEPYPGQLM